MNKTNKWTLRIAILCGYVMYSFILFMVNKNWMPSFWISYGFITLSFMCSFGLTFSPRIFAKGTNTTLFSPIVSVVVIYLIVEFVIGTIMMFFPLLPIKTCFLIQVPILILFVIIGLVLFTGNKQISNQIAKQREKEIYFDDIEEKLESIFSMTSDAKNKRKIRSLIDDIKYSGNMNHPALNDIKKEIENNLEKLTFNVTENNEVEIEKSVYILKSSIDRLNAKIKNLKSKGE